jgi:hypothetical protein
MVSRVLLVRIKSAYALTDGPISPMCRLVVIFVLVRIHGSYIFRVILTKLIFA